jgi:hypothetical protein
MGTLVASIRTISEQQLQDRVVYLQRVDKD